MRFLEERKSKQKFAIIHIQNDSCLWNLPIRVKSYSMSSIEHFDLASYDDRYMPDSYLLLAGKYCAMQNPYLVRLV